MVATEILNQNQGQERLWTTTVRVCSFEIVAQIGISNELDEGGGHADPSNLAWDDLLHGFDVVNS